MSPVGVVLEQLGGVASRAELTRVVTTAQVRGALRRGEIVRDRRGRYVAAGTADHLRVAHQITAVLSHESAAVHHGWKVISVPDLPTVTVRRKRHLIPADRARTQPHWRDLPAHDIRRGVTAPLQTVLDCARDLPLDRALAAADSALRAGDVSLESLREATDTLTGRGAARARRVSAHACYVAANPMESVLRAIALDVPGFAFVPQLRVWGSGLYATVDLGDEQLKVVLEAEGFAFHTGRREFRRDCRRYDELVAWGWTVFRFTWEQIMFEPDFVRWCLTSWLASRRGDRVLPAPRPPARLA